MRLAVEGLGVTLGGRRVLRDVSLAVAEGEHLAILGPSGSGKSTLLRVICGLQRPAAGRVLLDGVDATDVAAHRRGVGLVFQDASLFPHRSVGGNVGFGLELAGVGATERALRVAQALALVGLEGTEGREIATLSGGEAQRVALARAIAPGPRALLLDEPLGALDGPLRERLREDLRGVFERVALTVVHVTHDVAEAFALGDRVAVLREGEVAQIAPPGELWAHPADDWVARFLGMRNLRAHGDHVKVIRPEAVRLGPGGDAVVLAVERRGGAVLVRVRTTAGEMLEATTTDLVSPAPGDSVSVEIDPAGIVDVPAWAPEL